MPWNRETGERLIRQYKWGALLLLACGLTAGAAGCSLPGGDPAQQAPQPSKEAMKPAETNPEKAPEKTAVEPVYRAPLTGEVVRAPVPDRPVMVMVNNAPQARPQSGLSQADLLYEILAEGEITRLVAIYQSRTTADAVGPVRSIRPYFIELGQGFDALQVHAGGSPDGYAKLKRDRVPDLDEITNAGGAFWREKSRKAPHNLYTSLEKVRENAGSRGIGTPAVPVVSFPFAENDPVAAAEVTTSPLPEAPELEVTFMVKSYAVGYKYDPASRLYLRTISGSPHVDLNTGAQLTAANVIVMGADHKILDSEGRRDVRLTGKGKALLFQKGRVQEVEWRRESTGSPIRYWDGSQEIRLQTGATHVMIVPNAPDFQSHVKYGVPS